MWVRSEVMLTFGGARKVEVRDGTRLTNLKYKAEAGNGKGYLAAAGPQPFCESHQKFFVDLSKPVGEAQHSLHAQDRIPEALPSFHPRLPACATLSCSTGKYLCVCRQSPEKVWR